MSFRLYQEWELGDRASQRNRASKKAKPTTTKKNPNQEKKLRVNYRAWYIFQQRVDLYVFKTCLVPGQPQLHKEALSRKTKNKSKQPPTKPKDKKENQAEKV